MFKIIIKALVGFAAIGVGVAIVVSLIENPTGFPSMKIMFLGGIKFVGLGIFVAVVLWAHEAIKELRENRK